VTPSVAVSCDRFRRFGALSEHEFRLLFIGQSISAFGDRLMPVAIAFAVLDLTGSASDLGLVLAAETLPTVLLLLVGGVWGDRTSRRLVMVASDLVRCGSQTAMAVLLLTESAQLWQLVVLSGTYGAGSAFFSPASTGLVPQTVSAARLQQANASLDAARNAVGIVGPAAAGVIVAATSPGWAMAADAATFVISVWTLLLLHPRQSERIGPRDGVVSDLRAGWREFRSRTWLWASVAYFSVFTLFAYAPVNVLGPYIAKHSLGGVAAWATILAAGGVGAVFGGLIALHVRPERPLFVAYGVLLMWIPQMGLLALRAPVAAIAVASAAGWAMTAFSSTLWFTTMQQHVPDDALSRVSAYDYFGSSVFWPLGFALVGPLAARAGSDATLWASAAISVVSTGVILMVPSVRRLGQGVAVVAPGAAPH
jgi:MFS family permease